MTNINMGYAKGTCREGGGVRKERKREERERKVYALWWRIKSPFGSNIGNYNNKCLEKLILRHTINMIKRRLSIKQ